MRTWLLAVAAAAVCACARGGDSSRTADWTVRDSAGVTIVSNHTRAFSRACVTIDPRSTTTIRSDVRRDDSVPPLYDVRGGAVLRDGRIVILNAGSRELLFYGSDGRYEYAVGGSGRGPGEFVAPTWLGRGTADTLFVWDTRLGRLSTFDANGTLLSSRQVGFEGATGPPPAIGGRFEDGSFFANPGPLVFFSGAERGVIRLAQTYQRYDPVTDRIGHLADGRSDEVARGGGGWYSVPFGKTDVVVAHGATLVVGDNGIPALRSYDMDGRLRRVVEWVADSIAVTAGDRTAYSEYMASVSPRLAPPADAVFAAERPIFSWISSDRTGWIWVKLFAGRWEPPAPWLVFDGDGVLRCEVEAPGRVAVLEIGERYLLGVQRNELDEETVVRFTLVRSAR